MKLPARENQIAPNQNKLIVNKSLYRPHFKAHLNHIQNNIIKNNTNYETENKLPRNFMNLK